jgi:hypothetical protein
MRFDIFTALITQTMIFWGVTSRKLTGSYQYSGRQYYPEKMEVVCSSETLVAIYHTTGDASQNIS